MFGGGGSRWRVWYYVFIVVNITRTLCSRNRNNENTAGLIDKGDVVVGGLFRIRKISGTNNCSEEVEVEVGIQRVEAMLYAVHEINKDPGLLPNVRLGAEIRDTCSLKTKALDESLKFILDSPALRSIPQRNERCFKNISNNVVGVVGPSRSTLSIEVAKLLRLFKVPQVSYASTSAELSNKKEYSYFARTVPPDSLQAKAMLHIVKEFHWMSVFTINSAGSYGEAGIKQFKKQSENSSVCVVMSEQVTDECKIDKYYMIIERFKKFASTKVLILFLKDNHLKMLLQAAKDEGFNNTVWIASDEWGTREDIVKDFDEFFNNSDAITVALPSLRLPKFEKYFQNLTGSSPRRENPWFQQYWRQCGNSACNKSFNDKLPYIIDAVYAFAHALHTMYVEKCPSMTGLCPAMRSVNGTELRDRILNVEFKGKSSQVSFDENGDSKGKYAVFLYTGHTRYQKLGEWQDKLNLTNVPARLRGIRSICSDECNPWSRKLVKEETMCCFRCLDCPNKERQYVNATEEAKCVYCDKRQRPNANYSGCEDLPLRHISSTWFITITFFASFGALTTLFVSTLFMYNINTPLVKASERDLIFLLLLGILLNYTMAIVFVTRANVIMCAVQRFGYGFSASICYSSLLVKIDRIGGIFTSRTSKSVHFTKPHTHLVILFLLNAVEVSLVSAGLVIQPPKIIEVEPTNKDIFAKCNFRTLDMMISLPYNLILIVFCTFYSFRIRKTAHMFNEPRYLGLVMYSTCIIWLAFIPVNIGIAESYQPIALSLNTTLNATTILVCLFGPKVYVIVFRPIRNSERSASIISNHFKMNQQSHESQSNHVRKKNNQDTSTASSNQSRKDQTHEQVDSENKSPNNNVNEIKNTHL